MVFSAGCLALYVRQEKFHSDSTKTLEFAEKKAESRVENFRDLWNYLEASKHVGVGWTFLPPNMKMEMNKVEKKVDHLANSLQQKTDKNSDDIREALDSVRVILIVIATVAVFIAILGSVFSIWGNKGLVHTMVITGWILVTLTFVLSGIFLALHNISADTCVAMDEWVETYTKAHTAFDHILPCVYKSTAQKTLNKTKDLTILLVTLMDRMVIGVSNLNVTPIAGILYYNQSGPLVPALCNPFHYNRTHRNCADDEVDFIHAAMEWRNYVCEVSETGRCTTVGRLRPNMYEELVGTLNVSYALYHYGPFLVDVEECLSVRDAVREIGEDHCPSLRRHTICIAMLLAMVSASLMVSVIFWLLHSRHNQKCSYRITASTGFPDSNVPYHTHNIHGKTFETGTRLYNIPEEFFSIATAISQNLSQSSSNYFLKPRKRYGLLRLKVASLQINLEEIEIVYGKEKIKFCIVIGRLRGAKRRTSQSKVSGIYLASKFKLN
ncbi:hypothetical protein FNV43_RR07017 [Rhamnella rubrinervis]|uniref:Uncharacterized protein n=1 Tax=Rhamnella rubrinervis TaxID=2594499 RepID=A0A8K0HFR5_9ROSA|nr:hypothetical protein FNV43_RR07017 [Rhamnella rubrinervis]